MLRKISLISFGFTIFSALLFVLPSAGYAQASMTFEDINQNYKTRKLTIPKSEIKYQEALRLENERFRDAQEALKDIKNQEAQNIAEAKKTCGTDLNCRNYLNSEGKRLINEFVKTMNQIKETYSQRIKQLRAARGQFDSMEMRIDSNINRPNRIRVCERRVDDSLIRQNRKSN